MRRLIIDTATGACSVALFDGDACIAGDHAVIGRGHAERLLPMIAALPEKGRAEAIYANIGPGSFTGVRVGVSAARALAYAWQIASYGYQCLHMIAAIARSEQDINDEIDVVMTGGHGEYFFQRFDHNGAAIVPASSLAPVEAARKSLAPYVVGNAAEALCQLRGNGHPIATEPDARQFHVLPSVCREPLTPLYGRGPDAKLPKERTA